MNVVHLLCYEIATGEQEYHCIYCKTKKFFPIIRLNGFFGTSNCYQSVLSGSNSTQSGIRPALFVSSMVKLSLDCRVDG